MGIFDIFSDQPAKDAAAAQIAGLNKGYSQASGNIFNAVDSLNQNYGQANATLGQNYGAGANALQQNYGSGIQSLTGNFGQGIDALKGNYSQALAPYQQNYGQAQAGVGALGNALGLNGQAGSDAALTQLRNTPGYKFQQQSLDDTVNAQAAASGMNASGNQLLALNKVNQGLADSTSNNWISQLQPFLGAAGNAASGIANTFTGLGNSLASGYGGLGTSLANAYSGLGNAQASNSANLGNAQAGVFQGLGSGVANQQDQLAQLGYSTNTGIGNANANADLARYSASGNLFNFLGSLGGMKMPGGGTAGGNAFSSLMGSAGGTSVGGAPLEAGSGLMGAGSSLMAMFSDERLKEDIEPVGEMYDGTNIYRYRYKGDPMMRIGVMAQEVEQVNPDAVIEIGGYKAVDYGRATQYASELSKFREAA